MTSVEWRMRQAESALDFENGGAYLSDSDSLDGFTDGFTMMMYVDTRQRTETSDYTFLISKGSFSGSSYSITDEPGRHACRLSLDGEYSNSVSVSYSGSESVHHMAYRYDPETGYLSSFLNGERVDQKDVGAGQSVDATGNAVRIGDGGSAGTYYGGLDEIYLYSRPVTDNEIARYVDQKGEPDPQGLELYLPFNEGAGDIAEDQSGNGNHASVQSAEWVDPPVYRTIDDRLVDVQNLTLAYNRFAREADAVLDDPDGTVALEYPKPTPLLLEVKRNIDDAWTTRFGGYVVAADRERQQTTLELLSHDAWLRSRDVYRRFVDTPISAILEELITSLTPLEWTPALVDVADDQVITREWKGTPLDSVLEELSSSSRSELFGATFDMEFFFEQRDTSRAPRDFRPGEYTDTSFEQDGSHELNEVTVYYGGNPANEAVVVEDRQNQRALKETLGAESNVVISTSTTRTEIATEAAAERKGSEILANASEILTGSVETWDGFGIDPGDVTRVVEPAQNIDAEFRVAEIVHNWSDDATDLTLAENSEGVVDTLVDLSDEVNRLDARAAGDDATITRMTGLEVDFDIDFELEAFARTYDPSGFSFGELRGGLGERRDGYPTYVDRFRRRIDPAWSINHMLFDGDRHRPGGIGGSAHFDTPIGDDYQAAIDVFEPGVQPSSFRFFYRETTNSYGHGIRLFNSAGDVEAGFATDNPEYVVDSAAGFEEVDGDEYDAWVRVDVDVDWSAGTFDARFENLSTGHGHTFADRELKAAVDVVRLQIEDLNEDLGGWQDGREIDSWIDDASFVVDDAATPVGIGGGTLGDPRSGPDQLELERTD